MYLRRSAVLKYLVLAPLGIILYCEWLDYVIQPLFWHDLECPADDKSCTKILFIADPQIQGDQAVPPPLSYIFNWDSDKYLKSTFSVVLKHFRPDVLVFLGDLMDEGSIATMPQFHSYVKRVMTIFDVEYPVVQVWLPGDNDIGGENEPVRKNKVAEFERVFQQPQVITFRNISFFKVNAITNSIPDVALDPDDTNYRIVVSHYPILPRGLTAKQVNKAIRPNVFFCAHDHQSKYTKQSKDLTTRKTYPLMYGAPVLNVGDDEDLYEIYVPTCSYRMGTSKMGYGAAVLENHNQHMKYTVFWSPQRFPHIVTYILIGVILLASLLIICMRLLFSRSKVLDKSDDTLSLLQRI